MRRSILLIATLLLGIFGCHHSGAQVDNSHKLVSQGWIAFDTLRKLLNVPYSETKLNLLSKGWQFAEATDSSITYRYDDLRLKNQPVLLTIGFRDVQVGNRVSWRISNIQYTTTSNNSVAAYSRAIQRGGYKMSLELSDSSTTTTTYTGTQDFVTAIDAYHSPSSRWVHMWVITKYTEQH